MRGGRLAVGLATLPSPDAPIADPWFTAMEVPILVMMPGIVGYALVSPVALLGLARVFATAPLK